MRPMMGNQKRRPSQRCTQRLTKAARTVAGGAVAVAIGTSSAWAQCATTGDLATFSNINNYIPFAQGSSVNAIISTVNTVNTGSLAQSTAFVGSPPGAKADQQGAGSWSRVIGGTVETKTDSTANLAIDNFNVTPGVTTDFSGAVNCHSTTKQSFIGTQTGFDIARHNFNGGANLHVGLTAGWFDVTTKDRTPGESTFEADSQIPFGGIYGALYAGPWTIDAQVRWDFIQNEYTDVRQGIFSQKHNAHSTAFLWNIAYRQDLPQNWYLEPSIGGVWSNTAIDDLSVPGTFAAGDINGSSPGTLQIEDVDSVTGRASVRVGKNFVTGKLAWTSFVTASVFHEFAGNVQSTIVADDRNVNVAPGVLPTFASAGTISSSRVGTYGHIGWGLAGTILDTGWLGYARLDYRKGDDLESFTVNAGFRYQFAPVSEIQTSLKDGGDGGYAPTGFNWTGFYGGWLTGANWGSPDFAFANGSTTSPDFSGYLTGGQVGYDLQMGQVVIGIAADTSYSNAEGGQSCPNGLFFTCTSKMEQLSMLTGRIGLAHDRALVYVKGGVAFADVTLGFTPNGGAAVAALQGLDPSSSANETMTGWTAGAGIEFAFLGGWSANAEYMYYDLGKERFDTTTPFDAEVTGNTIRFGLNYRLGHREAEYHRDALK
ncbi:MAG: autotransporter domain-containing protein [Hyphomicrobiaceae bacterium]